MRRMDKQSYQVKLFMCAKVEQTYDESSSARQDGTRGHIVLNIVHSSNSVLGVSLVGVAHESETTAATSVSIFDDNLEEKLHVRPCLLGK